jgi:hypothetical protein
MSQKCEPGTGPSRRYSFTHDHSKPGAHDAKNGTFFFTNKSQMVDSRFCMLVHAVCYKVSTCR